MLKRAGVEAAPHHLRTTGGTLDLVVSIVGATAYTAEERRPRGSGAVWRRWVFAERCRLIPGRLGERIKMKVQTQTIEQLARVLDVDERKVSRTARRVLGLSTAMVRDPGLGLSRTHCRQIAQALGRPDPWAAASSAFALSSPRAARRPALKRDPCARGELTFGRLLRGL